MNLARYRKALAVGILGLVQVAAYVAADPRDLPAWVVTAAAAVNTLAVWWVRNAPAAERMVGLAEGAERIRPVD